MRLLIHVVFVFYLHSYFLVKSCIKRSCFRFVFLQSALYMIDKEFYEALYSCICYLFACLTFQKTFQHQFVFQQRTTTEKQWLAFMRLFNHFFCNCYLFACVTLQKVFQHQFVFQHIATKNSG